MRFIVENSLNVSDIASYLGRKEAGAEIKKYDNATPFAWNGETFECGHVQAQEQQTLQILAAKEPVNTNALIYSEYVNPSIPPSNFSTVRRLSKPRTSSGVSGSFV